MTDKPHREPRGSIAKRAVRPRQPWEAIYESYTPLDEPLPWPHLALLLYTEGLIWIDGGTPDPAVLCQVIAQTDPGLVEDAIDDPDLIWQFLVDSLVGLPWGKGQHARQAFAVSCALLNHTEQKDEAIDALSNLADVAIDRTLTELGYDPDTEIVQEGPLASDPESVMGGVEEELAGVDVEPMMMDGAEQAVAEMNNLEALRTKLAEPAGPRCVMCGGAPEVSYPDGHGNQVHYCGIHEPRDDIDEVYDTSERPEGVVRKRL